VADIANLIRDGKVDEAMTLQLKNGYPQYQQIEGLVNQVVKTEEDKMGTLGRIVTAAHRRALILMGGFVGASILLALLLGFVISWSFILPVQEAQGFLGQVAQGDFSTTINVPNRDEFGALAAHMNQMSRAQGLPGYEETISQTKKPPVHLSDGKELFQENCAGCHGEAGYGDGAAGAGRKPDRRRRFKSFRPK